MSTKAQVKTILQIENQEFKKEARFYIDIAYFVIEHYLPYSSTTHFVNFSKYIASTYDNDLLQRCHTSDTTISKVINHCISGSLKENLIQDLDKIILGTKHISGIMPIVPLIGVLLIRSGCSKVDFLTPGTPVNNSTRL